MISSLDNLFAFIVPQVPRYVHEVGQRLIT